MRYFLVVSLVAVLSFPVHAADPTDGDRPNGPPADEAPKSWLFSRTTAWVVGGALLLGFGGCAVYLFHHGGGKPEVVPVDGKGGAPLTDGEKADLLKTGVVVQSSGATRVFPGGPLFYVRKGMVFQLAEEGAPKPLLAEKGTAFQSLLAHDGHLVALTTDGEVLLRDGDGWTPLAKNVKQLASRQGRLYAVTKSGELLVYGGGGDAFRPTGTDKVAGIVPADDSEAELKLELVKP